MCTILVALLIANATNIHELRKLMPRSQNSGSNTATIPSKYRFEKNSQSTDRSKKFELIKKIHLVRKIYMFEGQ